MLAVYMKWIEKACLKIVGASQLMNFFTVFHSSVQTALCSILAACPRAIAYGWLCYAGAFPKGTEVILERRRHSNQSNTMKAARHKAA